MIENPESTPHQTPHTHTFLYETPSVAFCCTLIAAHGNYKFDLQGLKTQDDGCQLDIKE